MFFGVNKRKKIKELKKARMAASEATSYSIRPIGVIDSPFEVKEGTPIQHNGNNTSAGTITIFEEYAEGLMDLEGFSHIIVLYRFNRHDDSDYKLHCIPYLDNVPHGIFATRSPKRPNQIGLSIFKLIKRIGNVLEVEGLDVLKGTPVIDIKPYVPSLNPATTDVRVGWFQGKEKEFITKVADSKF